MIRSVLSFDPGAATGYAVWDIAGARITTLGRFTEPSAGWKGDGTRTRRGEYIARLRGVLLGLQGGGLRFDQTQVVVESVHVSHKNPSAAVPLAMRVGMIVLATHTDATPDPVMVPPGTWKAALGLNASLGGSSASREYVAHAATLPGVVAGNKFSATGDAASAACLAAFAGRRVAQGLPVLLSEAEKKAAQRERDRAKRARMPGGWEEIHDGTVWARGRMDPAKTLGVRLDGTSYLAWVGSQELLTEKGRPRRFRSAPSAARAAEAAANLTEED